MQKLCLISDHPLLEQQMPMVTNISTKCESQVSVLSDSFYTGDGSWTREDPGVGGMAVGIPDASGGFRLRGLFREALYSTDTHFSARL